MEMTAPTASSPGLISLGELELGRQRIAPFIKRTSLVRNHVLSDRLGANVYLKLKMFQRTGSFKIRGAFNKMLSLSEAEHRGGVVAVSGGNHAQAVACAPRRLEVRALLLMPESTNLCASDFNDCYRSARVGEGSVENIGGSDSALRHSSARGEV